jgi:hypothetical protein
MLAPKQGGVNCHALFPAAQEGLGAPYPTFTVTRVMVSLPKMSITFTATV